MARFSNASGLTGAIAGGAPATGHRSATRTVGQSFTVPELMIMSAWAEYYGLRLVIELDTCVDDAEYEEVAAFYSPGLQIRRWSMWRSEDGLVLERLNAPAIREACVGKMLERLSPPHESVTGTPPSI